MLKKLWYESFKIFLKITLHFYTKRIHITGQENIPKKGAVLFTANHPNALMDPLYIAAFNKREINFLVRADVFKKSLIKKMFATLNMMPIYRMRDGRSSLSNNQEIFEKCYGILNQKKSLLIFPQGGHSRDRTIPQLSKGFTRILFGALAVNTDLEIHVIPVGITYQNSTQYPSKVAIQYGTPIAAHDIIKKNATKVATETLKKEVRDQLKSLCVHIPMDDNYQKTLQMLNDASVNYTDVSVVNEVIQFNQQLPKKPKNRSIFDVLYLPTYLNLLFPFLAWKLVAKNIKQIEFVDTFKFGIGVLLAPIFLVLQSVLLASLTSTNVGVIYLIASVLLFLIYTKTASTPTES